MNAKDVKAAQDAHAKCGEELVEIVRKFKREMRERIEDRVWEYIVGKKKMKHLYDYEEATK